MRVPPLVVTESTFNSFAIATVIVLPSTLVMIFLPSSNLPQSELSLWPFTFTWVFNLAECTSPLFAPNFKPSFRVATFSLPTFKRGLLAVPSCGSTPAGPSATLIEAVTPLAPLNAIEPSLPLSATPFLPSALSTLNTPSLPLVPSVFLPPTLILSAAIDFAWISSLVAMVICVPFCVIAMLLPAV